MKLIDLLVQELPKRGGWPQNVTHIGQDYDRELMFYGRGRAMTGIFLDELATDHRKCFGNGAKITQEQYESALAASQKPAWNGEGLPPVGCECVVTPHNTMWGFSSVDDYTGRVLAYDGEDFWFVMLGGVKVTSRTDKVDFRPIKSEADKKRDAAINNILTIIDCNGVDPKNSAIQIYDAIAAGKIPGVKLDD